MHEREGGSLGLKARDAISTLGWSWKSLTGSRINYSMKPFCSNGIRRFYVKASQLILLQVVYLGRDAKDDKIGMKLCDWSCNYQKFC